MNLLNKMTKIEEIKIEIKETKIIIYNFKKILDLENNRIETKDYIIFGENLSISQVSKYDLILNGKLKEIKVKDYE